MAAVEGMASPHPARDPEGRFSEFQHHIDDMLNEGHTNPPNRCYAQTIRL
jgi:hypothetical protein